MARLSPLVLNGVSGIPPMTGINYSACSSISYGHISDSVSAYLSKSLAILALTVSIIASKKASTCSVMLPSVFPLSYSPLSTRTSIKVSVACTPRYTSANIKLYVLSVFFMDYCHPFLEVLKKKGLEVLFWRTDQGVPLCINYVPSR
ncbi:hypothetical protein C8J57DRAFT_1730622 [Mycena rebaudengoi]|nr:hypothetical protein C8J57DRAFT_1730622 [Mycena rebaudengoi]